MRLRVTPARRRGVEILDDPATPDDVRRRSMEDVARSNALFGGTRTVVRALDAVLPALPRDATLLDVGTGMADIPAAAQRHAARAGIGLTTFGVDVSEAVLRSVRDRLTGAAVGSALRLPVASNAVDVVTCSQVLHHFVDVDARNAIAELHRISRGWIVICDLRRSWAAAGGFWLASVALGFHAVTRHDGVASVLRGFTAHELGTLVRDSTGVRPTIRRGAFWRLSATWAKASSRA